jgi:uncharacterized protein (TIGR03083 family)
MVDDDQRHVERLEEVWSSTGRLGDSLTESQWKAPTECPGWDVQDNLAHIVGLESLLLGRPVPDAVAPDHAHVKNDMGRTNELWVEAFRGRPGAEVLDEFRSVTAEPRSARRTWTSAPTP